MRVYACVCLREREREKVSARVFLSVFVFVCSLAAFNHPLFLSIVADVRVMA